MTSHARPRTRSTSCFRVREFEFPRQRGPVKPASPIANQDEEEVDCRWIEPLRSAVPASVAATRRDCHVPAFATASSLRPEGRGLHLDPNQLAVELRHQVDVRAMPDWDPDMRTLAREPLHRRELAQVALDAAIDRSHATVRSCWGSSLVHERMFAYVSDRKLRIENGSSACERMVA